jgi:hypothetical protein
VLPLKCLRKQKRRKLISFLFKKRKKQHSQHSMTSLRPKSDQGQAHLSGREHPTFIALTIMLPTESTTPHVSQER